MLIEPHDDEDEGAEEGLEAFGAAPDYEEDAENEDLDEDDEGAAGDEGGAAGDVGRSQGLHSDRQFWSAWHSSSALMVCPHADLCGDALCCE